MAEGVSDGVAEGAIEGETEGLPTTLDNSLWIGKVRTLNMEINEWARNTKTKKYLVEEFDEDVHGEFVPYRVLLLGLLTYLIVHNGDKVLEVNQFHLTKLCKCGKV